MIRDKNKCQYVYFEDFNRFMCNKIKNKNIKHFCKCSLHCFSSEKVLIEHKENFLIINGTQNIKLKSGSIKFKSFFKQLTVPLKIYTDFESLLKGVRSNARNNNTSYPEKYQKHITCSFACKVVCVDDKFSKPVVLYRGKNAINRFIKAILEECHLCKKIIKKHLISKAFKSI